VIKRNDNKDVKRKEKKKNQKSKVSKEKTNRYKYYQVIKRVHQSHPYLRKKQKLISA